MKKGFFKKLAAGVISGLMCLTMLPQSLTSSLAASVGDKLSVGNGMNQHKGNCDGYSYEVWIDSTGGSGSMTLGQGAAFTAEWSANVNAGNFLARRGLDFGSQKKATDYPYIGMDYEADYRQTGSASGNSRLCVYGWFQNKGAGNVPLVEYYIIEDWVDWCPDASGKMVTIDGAQYKIFQMDHTGPTINGGSETFKQYFSVRQQKRTSGHITVSDHFKAWADEGWGIGNLYEVALNAEGWQSSGVADVKKLDVYTDPSLAGTGNTGVGDDTPSKPIEPDANGYFFNSTFENGTDDWTGRGAATVKQSSGALAVTGRTDSWNGACISLDTAAFNPGKSYGFSVKAKQDSSASEDFKLTLQCTVGGEDQYLNVASATGANGEWVTLSNPSFTIPEGATNLILYVETDGTTTDFVIDDAIGAAENKIPVADTPNPGKVIPGDLNGDGVIDTYDIILERKAIVNAFAGVANSEAADIDGNGTVNVNDLVLLSKFLLGAIDKFPQAERPVTTAAPQPPAVTTTTAAPPSQGNTDGKSFMDSISNSITNNVPANITGSENNECKEEKIEYYSSIAMKNKKAVVILPPNYSTSKKYPVVYVNHGIFGSEGDMVGYCKSIGGNLMKSGEAEEMILVSCAMYTSQNSDQCQGFSAEECAKYDAFREDLIECLMPYMEEHYSVKTGRENTGICGFSMGGRESLYIGITRPQYFGYIGAACPAPGITPASDMFMTHPGNMQPSDFKIQDHTYDPYLLMITGGTNDSVVGTFPKEYHEMLTTNGQPHIWQEIQGGGHDASCVNPLMYNFLKNAFKAN